MTLRMLPLLPLNLEEPHPLQELLLHFAILLLFSRRALIAGAELCHQNALVVLLLLLLFLQKREKGLRAVPLQPLWGRGSLVDEPGPGPSNTYIVFQKSQAVMESLGDQSDTRPGQMGSA
jgi:hypothetical protein